MSKFELGQLVSTPGALALDGQFLVDSLARHVQGDWGDVCDEDKASNDAALEAGERLLSAYTTKGGVKLWIITEWDRSVTTCLLPSEY
jgi:hypothetical protein